MNVEHSVFARLCSRCREIMLEAGAPQVLVDVYQTAVGEPLQAFTDATQAVKKAQTRVNQAEKGKAATLAEMDRLFRMGRSATAAVVPSTVLPLTLKAQPTDTDKRDAIQELMTTLQENAGATWADNLLQGELGQKAPAAIAQLNESIEASNALQKAKATRLAALAPAWSAYLKYKRLVRDTLGAGARQHQRLRLRTVSTGKGDDAEVSEEDVPEQAEAAETEAAETEAAETEAPNVTAAPESVAVPSVH